MVDVVAAHATKAAGVPLLVRYYGVPMPYAPVMMFRERVAMAACRSALKMGARAVALLPPAACLTATTSSRRIGHRAVFALMGFGYRLEIILAYEAK
jgi:hypothetical protein